MITPRQHPHVRMSLASALAALAILGGALGVAGSASAAAPAAPDRGALVSSRHLAHIDVGAIRADLGRMGIEADEVRESVDTYRVVYRTVGAKGGRRLASGLVAVPDGAGSTPRMAVYEHGTQSARDEVPSSPKPDDGYLSGLILGSSGLVALAPDYLGLGSGPGTHPYLDVPSEVTASVDAIRAARTFLGRRGVEPDPRLMVTGFSQGAAAAIAVADELQTARPSGLSLAALAPISGPYDLRGVELPDALAGRLDRAATPFYIGYLLTAWQRLHHLFPSLAAAFRPPYDDEVTRLFSGVDDLPEVAAALPKTLGQMLTPRALAELRRPSGAFARALRSSEVCRGWTPAVPVHLFAARGDTVVPIANAHSCAAALRSTGSRVSLTDVGDVDHDHSAMRAVPKVALLFDRLAGASSPGH